MLNYKILSTTLLTLGLSLTTGQTFADKNSPFAQTFSPPLEQQFFQKFAQCDMSFFKWLKQHQAELGPYVTFVEHKNHVAFDLELLEHEEAETDDKLYYAKFKKPLLINGIVLTGYYFTEKDTVAMFNEEFNHNMRAYFWGFTTSEPTLQRTMRKLHQLQWSYYDNLRLANKQMIVDTRKSTTWVHKDFAMGVAPQPYTVEKALFVSGSYTPEIECSAQGDITPKLLKTLHPEL